MLKSTPVPPVKPRTASTGSPERPSTTAVDPNSKASSSRAGRTSIPMIVVHPATRAAMIADSPTVPVPKTAMLDPASGRNVRRTAPAPVWIPHPNGATSSSGTSGSSRTTLRSVATENVAKLDWPKKCEWISRPSTLSAVDPSGRQPPKFRA